MGIVGEKGLKSWFGWAAACHVVWRNWYLYNPSTSHKAFEAQGYRGILGFLPVWNFWGVEYVHIVFSILEERGIYWTERVGLRIKLLWMFLVKFHLNSQAVTLSSLHFPTLHWSPRLLGSSWPTLIPMVFSFSVVTDETLSFIQKSRRLLVVLSPNYVLQGTQALLELKAGLENMASRGNINVILVQYKAVKETKVKELKRAKTVLTVIKWKGEKSKYPQGRFWKQLQVAMPVKKSSRWSRSGEQGLSYSSLKNVWKGQRKV